MCEAFFYLKNLKFICLEIFLSLFFLIGSSINTTIPLTINLTSDFCYTAGLLIHCFSKHGILCIIVCIVNNCGETTGHHQVLSVLQDTLYVSYSVCLTTHL